LEATTFDDHDDHLDNDLFAFLGSRSEFKNSTRLVSRTKCGTCAASLFLVASDSQMQQKVVQQLL